VPAPVPAAAVARRRGALQRRRRVSGQRPGTAVRRNATGTTPRRFVHIFSQSLYSSLPFSSLRFSALRFLCLHPQLFEQ
jgi:hypothetical protein